MNSVNNIQQAVEGGNNIQVSVSSNHMNLILICVLIHFNENILYRKSIISMANFMTLITDRINKLFILCKHMLDFITKVMRFLKTKLIFFLIVKFTEIWDGLKNLSFNFNNQVRFGYWRLFEFFFTQLLIRILNHMRLNFLNYNSNHTTIWH